MNLIRLALAVGLAWVAATLLLKRRPVERLDADDGLVPFPSADPGLPVRVRAMTVPAGAARSVGGGRGFAPGA